METVLIIEDEVGIRENALELVEAEGYRGIGAADGKAGIAAALKNQPDVIVCDILMPAMDGLEVLRALRSSPQTSRIPFIFLTARAERADVREGMSLGAEDYLTKPYTSAELLESIRTRIGRRRALASRSSAALEPQPTLDHSIIVQSPKMKALFEQANRGAREDFPILILGETGVGKDVLSNAIHRASPRCKAPFFPLNCASIPESLIESELFGHEKSAFTHATHDQVGIFESANGGTVFLDEVAELSAMMQAKLLRVIEDRQVRPVGGRRFRSVDVRFIAATNKDLRAEIEEGRFRADLFFRLGGFTLTVPPLRERREETEAFARRFVEDWCHRSGRDSTLAIAESTLELLREYRWPGNVRELKHAMETAATLCDADVLLPAHLPEWIRSGAQTQSAHLRDDKAKLRDEIGEIEQKETLEALEHCGWNQTRAAQHLGISRRTLLYRLDRYEIPRPRKR